MKVFFTVSFFLFVFITDSYSQIDTTKVLNEEDIKIEHLNLKLDENNDLFYNGDNSTISNVISDNSISEPKVVVYNSKEYSENDYQNFIDSNSDSIKHPLIIAKEHILIFFSKDSSSNKLYIKTQN